MALSGQIKQTRPCGRTRWDPLGVVEQDLVQRSAGQILVHPDNDPFNRARGRGRESTVLGQVLHTVAWHQ